MERAGGDDYLVKGYDEVCRSYERIDDFRAKLLALLPGVSAALLVLLLGQEGVTAGTSDEPHLIVAAGVFGAIVTIGLLFYEERGIQRCVRLVTVGRQLEADMGVDGRFKGWPHSLWRTVHEPFASGLVYSAVFAAWVYVALISWSPLAANIGAGVSVIVGVLATTAFYWWVTWSEDRRTLELRTHNWEYRRLDQYDHDRLTRDVRRFRAALEGALSAATQPGEIHEVNFALLKEQAERLQRQVDRPHYRRDYGRVADAMFLISDELARARTQGECSGTAADAWDTLEMWWGKFADRLAKRIPRQRISAPH